MQSKIINVLYFTVCFATLRLNIEELWHTSVCACTVRVMPEPARSDTFPIILRGLSWSWPVYNLSTSPLNEGTLLSDLAEIINMKNHWSTRLSLHTIFMGGAQLAIYIYGRWLEHIDIEFDILIFIDPIYDRNHIEFSVRCSRGKASCFSEDWYGMEI